MSAVDVSDDRVFIEEIRGGKSVFPKSRGQPALLIKQNGYALGQVPLGKVGPQRRDIAFHRHQHEPKRRFNLPLDFQEISQTFLTRQAVACEEFDDGVLAKEVAGSQGRARNRAPSENGCGIPDLRGSLRHERGEQ